MAEEMTVSEAAEELGVTRAAVDQWIKAGRLTVHRTIGHMRLLRKIDVQRFKRLPRGWPKGKARKTENEK